MLCMVCCIWSGIYDIFSSSSSLSSSSSSASSSASSWPWPSLLLSISMSYPWRRGFFSFYFWKTSLRVSCICYMYVLYVEHCCSFCFLGLGEGGIRIPCMYKCVIGAAAGNALTVPRWLEPKLLQGTKNGIDCKSERILETTNNVAQCSMRKERVWELCVGPNLVVYVPM